MTSKEFRPEGGGVDVVEAGFDVPEEGGDLQSGSLEGLNLVHECEAGVGGTKSREGAALFRVEEAFGLGDGRQSDCHYPFQNFGNGFEEDDDSKGGGGVVGGLARLVQHYYIGGFQGGGVVPERH